ncbi:MAG: hypothetical protein US19_C0012G0031 [Candidatus Daviesbacteria bacterium GW2011_GWB1_36_5]|uniref:Uncharacterized protein n=1 Tax=Candidatus Daviesbacteria bacterium GW2011_GWB1_36_5 TaxID=1618426 RepID=A0A0G0EVU6_9BACT|nr:MAG: hypothetical protein US19_C0012G0031 [Candidatus Daviesbacteria bacterium GW2011_GWB1_36_5]
MNDMEETASTPLHKKIPFIHQFSFDSISKVLTIVLVVSLLGGIGTGYFLSTNSGSKTANQIPLNQKPATAQQDSRTFRDFAEGKIVKKPEPKQGEYTEGTHLLTRDGAMPVALTSSVVDLSLYETKKVKVFGETQKALKEGWLMDVGKVEEI